MLLEKINVELFRAKSPALARCKEEYLPLLNLTNLTCIVENIQTKICEVNFIHVKWIWGGNIPLKTWKWKKKS